MKKIVSVILIALLIAFTLTACGTPKPPAENDIIGHLTDINANMITVNNQDEFFDLTSLEITKRKTEEDYDDVYATITWDNDYYTVAGDYVLYYSYYDEGGWCLDNYEIISQNITPKSFPVSNEQFMSFISEYLSDCEFIDREVYANEYGEHTEAFLFTSMYEHGLHKEKLSCQYICTFSNEQWVEKFQILACETDWSNFIGTWKLPKEGFGIGGTTCKSNIVFEITDIQYISAEEIEVKYNYKVSMKDAYTGEVYNDTDEKGLSEVFKVRKYNHNILGQEIMLPDTCSGVRFKTAFSSSIYLSLSSERGVFCEGIDSEGDYFEKIA